MTTTDNRFRRTFEFTPEHRADLEKIKTHICAKTDTAAINYAVKLSARLADRDLSEIEQALSLWEEIERRVGGGGPVVVEQALSLWQEIGRRVGEGGTLVIEKGNPPSRTELVVLPLAAQAGSRPSGPQATATHFGQAIKAALIAA